MHSGVSPFGIFCFDWSARDLLKPPLLGDLTRFAMKEVWKRFKGLKNTTNVQLKKGR
jgi:hypothetical protein